MFDSFAGYASGGGVYSGDGPERLWIDHLHGRCTEYGGVLGVVEQGTDFGFCGGVHDVQKGSGYIPNPTYSQTLSVSPAKNDLVHLCPNV